MLRLRDIMTADVAVLTPETTIREAMETLARRHVSGAPVVQGTAIVGVVTSSDLMTLAAALSGVPTERELIGDAMDAPVQRTDEDDPDPDADCPAAYFYEMWEDAGADASARMTTASSPEWNALEEHDVSEVMTRSPLVTLPAEATVEEAADLMRRNRIHRILVTDNGTLAGIVSALDIAGAVADHRFTTRTFVFDHPRGGP
jgi:CBS domain-containing protein